MQTTKGFKSPIVNGDKNMINTNVKTYKEGFVHGILSGVIVGIILYFLFGN